MFGFLLVSEVDCFTWLWDNLIDSPTVVLLPTPRLDIHKLRTKG